MESSDKSTTLVDALRLGLDPQQVSRFIVPVTLQPETLLIRARAEKGEDCPLVVCLHPPRFSEFQFAQKIRDLAALRSHLVFPRGLHAHLVDLGGARTVGYDWVHYTGDNPSFRSSLAMASDYLDGVMEKALDLLPTDRRAIYLLGTEGAALFASIYGVSRNEVFAGIITIDGHLLPEIVAEMMPEKLRLPFLCLNHRRVRPRSRDDAGPPAGKVDALRRLGFPVTHEILRGDSAPWQEEVAIIISWLTQKAGIDVVEADSQGS